MQKNFPKEDMLGLIGLEGRFPANYELISNEIVDTTRWSIIHEVVFKHEGQLYITHYNVGATEYQDESPWEYENEGVIVEEAEEFTTTAYRRKTVI